MAPVRPLPPKRATLVQQGSCHPHRAVLVLLAVAVAVPACPRAERDRYMLGYRMSAATHDRYERAAEAALNRWLHPCTSLSTEVQRQLP